MVGVPMVQTDHERPRRFPAWFLPFWLMTSRPASAVAAEHRRADLPAAMRLLPRGDGRGDAEEYPQPLAGDRSVAQLAKLIAKTMPEDDPGTLRRRGRRQGRRLHPRRLLLAGRPGPRTSPRGSSCPGSPSASTATPSPTWSAASARRGRWDDRRGPAGRVLQGPPVPRAGDRVLDRDRPRGPVRLRRPPAPTPRSSTPHQFSIRWEGSVLAPETGEYEFVVRTEHAARLWVNDTEAAADRRLGEVGQRHRVPRRRSSCSAAGPIRCGWSSPRPSRAWTTRRRRRSPPPVKASIALEWKPPHRRRRGDPAAAPVAGRVPRDVRRRRRRSRRTTGASARSAARPSRRLGPGHDRRGHRGRRLRRRRSLRELAGVAGRRAPTASRKLRDVLPRVRRAGLPPAARPTSRSGSTSTASSRRPRDPETGRQAGRAARPEVAAVPLPRGRRRRPDAYDVAVAALVRPVGLAARPASCSRPPRPGKLATREQVASQAERMLADPRAQAKLREFLLHWLKVDQAPDLAKDPKRFPGFDAAVASDLRTSLELFLDDVVWGEASDFRQLLLADYAVPERPAGEVLRRRPARRRPVPEGRRSTRASGPGVLTHPYLLASFAYTATSSPIHRGVFLARSVLGRSLRPPPEAFAPLPPDLHPDLTTRERVALQTSPQACMTCHAMINPLGFTLENFDAVGRFRDEENGQADRRDRAATRPATGEIGEVRRRPRPGRSSWPTARRRTRRSSSSCSTTWSSSRSGPTGPRRCAELQKSFAANGFNIRKLVVEIVAASALTDRRIDTMTTGDAVAVTPRPPIAIDRVRFVGPYPERRRGPPTHPPRVPPRPGHRRRGPAVRPEPAEPRLRQPGRRASSGWSSCSAPTASCPTTFWPDEEGETFTLKESLKPLEPFQDQHADPARRLRQGPRRRRQPHARHRLPADRHRAVPRQHPGRLATPRRLGQRHLDRPGDQELPAEATRRRGRGSARWSSA